MGSLSLENSSFNENGRQAQTCGEVWVRSWPADDGQPVWSGVQALNRVHPINALGLMFISPKQSPGCPGILHVGVKYFHR
jgi:hypothetical protein